VLEKTVQRFLHNIDGSPQTRLWVQYKMVGGAIIGISMTVGCLKFLRMRRRLAQERKQENARRCMAGEPPLPEKEWFFKRWWQGGMALLQHAQKN
jgi:hypothetical protein